MEVITSNDSEIIKYRDYFKNYEGYLPCRVRRILGAKPYKKYMDNLKEKKLYDKYFDKFIVSRKYSYAEEIEELVNWVKENPQYSDFIMYVDKPSEQDLEETKKILGLN